jgi:hypothetical protein
MVASHTPRRSSARFGTIVAVRGVAVLASGISLAQESTQPSAASGVPIFDIDPSWPAPLPDNWVLGPVSGIGLDVRDHVILIQRNKSDSVSTADTPGPYVVELDAPHDIMWPRTAAVHR